jgi:hypothetical protein
MIKGINGNDVSLEPLPDIVQYPLCDYRYKYTSADHQYYILATYATIDGISRAKWSEYRCNNDAIIHEDVISLSKDFDEMIVAEEWIEEGYEAIPFQ